MGWSLISIAIPTVGGVYDVHGTGTSAADQQWDTPATLRPQKFTPYITTNPDVQAIWNMATVSAIQHHCDIGLAMKWLSFANSMLNIPDYVGADPLWMMHRIFWAIAQYYNALNIVWSNDPVARALYRTYFAGPPAGPPNDGIIDDSLYGGSKGVNYNKDWYIAGREIPFVYHADRVGLITRATVELFRRIFPGNDQNHIQFFQPMGLGLRIHDAVRQQYDDAGSPMGEPVQVEYASAVVNDVWGFGMSESEMGRGYEFFREIYLVNTNPWDWGTDNRIKNIYDNLTARNANGNGNFYGLPRARGVVPNARMPAGMVLSTSAKDRVEANASYGQNRDVARSSWDAVFAEDGNNKQVSASFGSLRPWLVDWLTVLQARKAEEVILQSRAFVVYTNSMKAQTNVGFWAEAANKDAGVQAAINAPEKGFQIAQQLAPIIGTAVGSFFGPLGSAAGGLIGGAISLILMGVDQLIPGNPSEFRKDDIGRYKPTYERGWLSGDPRSALAQPRQIIPDPASTESRFRAYMTVPPNSTNPSMLSGIGNAIAGAQGRPPPSPQDLQSLVNKALADAAKTTLGFFTMFDKEAPIRVLAQVTTSRPLSWYVQDASTALSVLGLTRAQWRTLTPATKFAKLTAAIAADKLPVSNVPTYIALIDAYAALTPSEVASQTANDGGIPMPAKLAIAGAVGYGLFKLLTIKPRTP